MQCAFAVAEVRKVTANLSQTCGFLVAEHLLQFCGICGCGIECKFAVPSTDKKHMVEVDLMDQNVANLRVGIRMKRSGGRCFHSYQTCPFTMLGKSTDRWLVNNP